MSFGDIVAKGNIRDEYKLGKKLGQGAFGKVKLATKINSDDEEYAVKMINLESINMDDMIAIGNEIEILTQIDHPNVIKLFELYQDDEYIYMIMEMMKGGE